MFEGQFEKRGTQDAENRADLHRFRWTDLVAKLAATRDLREELGRGDDGDFRNFSSARREGGESKPTVNQDDLSRGKRPGLSLVEPQDMQAKAIERKND